MDNKLSPRKRKAIEALLSQPNVTAAAKMTGIHKDTIYRWLKVDPDFKAALNDATSQALNALSISLVGLASESIKALQEIITDKKSSPGSRLKAAEINLNNLLRIVELVNIDTRVNELEVTIKQGEYEETT